MSGPLSISLAEVEIGGQTYQIGAMPALTQLHVARRLAPILSSLGEAVVAADGMPKDEWLMSVFAPVSGAVASMPDADVDYIVTTCLGAVRRAQGDGKWAPVQRGTQLMFQDIGMPEMLRLTVAVVRERLGPFFGEALGALGSPSVSDAPASPLS